MILLRDLVALGALVRVLRNKINYARWILLRSRH